MRSAIKPNEYYLLINHGPTVLVVACHEGEANIMPASWYSPLSLQPPRLTLVLNSGYTRELVERSGELTLNIPTAPMLDTVYQIGRTSGRSEDKFKKFGIKYDRIPGSSHLLVQDCIGWLICRVSIWQPMKEQAGLFILDVEETLVDARAFDDKAVLLEGGESTIHHVSAGRFYKTGSTLFASR